MFPLQRRQTGGRLAQGSCTGCATGLTGRRPSSAAAWLTSMRAQADTGGVTDVATAYVSECVSFLSTETCLGRKPSSASSGQRGVGLRLAYQRERVAHDLRASSALDGTLLPDLPQRAARAGRCRTSPTPTSYCGQKISLGDPDTELANRAGERGEMALETPQPRGPGLSAPITASSKNYERLFGGDIEFEQGHPTLCPPPRRRRVAVSGHFAPAAASAAFGLPAVLCSHPELVSLEVTPSRLAPLPSDSLSGKWPARRPTQRSPASASAMQSLLRRTPTARATKPSDESESTARRAPSRSETACMRTVIAELSDRAARGLQSGRTRPQCTIMPARLQHGGTGCGGNGAAPGSQRKRHVPMRLFAL
uniref:Uncharacterized protein n=1 Tax=Macrostomum lignano TaxID=282301 RepID=A0A1I8FC33_9PLAT